MVAAAAEAVTAIRSTSTANRPRSLCSCGIAGEACRGEDSNLCRIAEHVLRVGHPDQVERIYIAQEADHGAVKIGTSHNPSDRVRVLQVGNPRPLFLVAWRDVAAGTERRLHRHLSPHLISGEWYEPHPEVLDVIACVLCPRNQRSS